MKQFLRFVVLISLNIACNSTTQLVYKANDYEKYTFRSTDFETILRSSAPFKKDTIEIKGIFTVGAEGAAIFKNIANVNSTSYEKGLYIDIDTGLTKEVYEKINSLNHKRVKIKGIVTFNGPDSLNDFPGTILIKSLESY